MATALDIINRAARLISVLAEGESLTAQQSEDGLTALNDMVASWEHKGVAIGAPAWALNTTIPLPNNHLKALAYNLAVEIAPEYEKAVSELVMIGATEGLADLKKDYGMPQTMILDSAVRRYRRGSVF